ncbi:MAG: putative ABC transporter permease [Bacilli bacterium]|nr:putative ABC transporter permease [Bacilli bacterium]
MYYYINSFYIYGFIGYIYEVIVGFLLHHKFFPNLLTEPIKPIYGFGVIIILLIQKIIFNKLKLSKKAKIITYFFTTIIVLTTLEYLSGIVLKMIFHKSFWNYSNYFLHIGKYICVWVSILWGIMALLQYFLLKPKIDKIIKKIPKWFTNIVLIITIIDILISLIN